MAEACNFAHSGTAGQSRRCKHFTTKGTCKRGEKCDFVHDARGQQQQYTPPNTRTSPYPIPTLPPSTLTNPYGTTPPTNYSPYPGGPPPSSTHGNPYPVPGYGSAPPPYGTTPTPPTYNSYNNKPPGYGIPPPQSQFGIPPPSSSSPLLGGPPPPYGHSYPTPSLSSQPKPYSPYGPMSTPPTNFVPRKTCRHWASGICDRGESCTFLHASA
jgi:hypothetical protein